MDEDGIESEIFETISNSSSFIHIMNGTLRDERVELNYSEYIVPPEKEGSPFEDCASIVLKSDLKVC